VKSLDYNLMSKTKQKLMPELRFPEFKDEREWDYFNGNKLFKTVSNKNHNSDLTILAVTQDQGAVPREDINYHVSVSKKSVESYKIVDKGDFIISLRSFQGGIEYSNYLGICSPAYIILRKRKKQDLNAFYKHYFKTDVFISNLNKNLEGIRDGKMVSYKQFSEILIPEPQPKEQKKIAACLSSLDDLITAHNDKLVAIQRHKKGLLQNLFPQEGQKVPNYRFKEFKNYGEWKEDTLTGICEVNPRSTELPNEFIYIDLESVHNGILIKKNSIDRINAPSRAQRLLKNKDVIFQMVRPYQRNNFHFIKDDIFNYVASTGYAQLRAFNSSQFLFQLMHTDVFVKRVLTKCSGSNYPAIRSSDLSNIIISIPKPVEQQKIAACLSSVDELITAQKEKIEQLKLQKKGFLQGLFPKVD